MKGAIAFCKGWHNAVFDAESAEIHEIPVRANDLQLSLDGNRIAYSKDYQIHVANVDGSSTRVLPKIWDYNYQPAWSPSGDKIAFVAVKEDDNILGISGGDEAAIYTVEVDGSNPTLLIPKEISPFADEVVWSPRGDKIAFQYSYGEIYVVNADGTHATKIAHGAEDPSWCPKGERIAFSAGFSGAFGIYSVNADGTGLTRLTRGRDSDPIWSPDGNWIIFIRLYKLDTGYHSEVYVMHPDGSDIQRLMGPFKNGITDLVCWLP